MRLKEIKVLKSKNNSNIITYIFSFVASAIGILLNFFLARVLQAESYGRLQYMIALSTTCSQFMIIGMNTFLIREAKNEKQNFDVFSKCASLFIFMLIFEIPLLSFFLKSDKTLSNVAKVYVILVSSLMGLDLLITALFQGKGKYKLTVIFENLIPKGFLLLVSLLFFALGNIAYLEEYYLIFYIFIYTCIAIPILIKHFKGFKICFTTSEITSIFFFFGVTVTYSLGNNLTKVLQGGLYQNDVALGIISVSISIVSLVRVFTSVLDNIVKPLFAKLKRNSNDDELLDVYRFDTRMNSYVSIPLYLFFIVFNTRFLSLFGGSFTAYPMILSILALANAVSDLTGPNGTMLAMTGKEKWELFNGILYFAIYILSVFIFSFDRIYGLCWALLVAQFCVNVAKFIEVWILYKKPPLDKKSIFSILLIIIIDGASIIPLKFIDNSIIWFAVGIALGVILVIINCFVISLYRKKDFKFLLDLRV